MQNVFKGFGPQVPYRGSSIPRIDSATQSPPSMELIPFFRAGTHTTTSGHDLAFSESDVAATASAYDPNVHEAPIVVGHPSDDSPAFGWAESVLEDDGLLAATPRKVEPQFEEMVKDGRFEKVSAKFYPPGHSHHPLGEDSDIFYLRHIGFLGAQPPAIKGLPGVEFSDEEADLVEVEVSFAEAAFAEMPSWMPMAVRDVFRRLREYLVESEGVEAADQVVPRYRLDDLEQIEDEAQQEDLGPETTAFAEHTDSDSSDSPSTMNFLDALLRVQFGKMLRGSDKSRSEVLQELADAAGVDTRTIKGDMDGSTGKVPEERLKVYSDELGLSMDELMEAKGMDMEDTEFAEQYEALSEKEKKLRQKERELEKREREQKREEVVAFVEDHIGRVTPAHKDTVTEALLVLDQQDVEVQFGEGDGAEEKAVGEALRDFVEALPQQVEFSEVTADDDTEERPDDDAQYARKLTERAIEFKEEKAKKGVTVTIDQAVAAVKEDFEEPSLD